MRIIHSFGSLCQRYNRGLAVFSLALLITGTSSCGVTAKTQTNSSQPDTSSPCFIYWEQYYPQSEWVEMVEGNLNDDDNADLLVIYREGTSECYMVAVVNLLPVFRMTEPVAAPVEGQVIDIFDMDGSPPKEFSVSGRKGVNVGSAVFRLEKGQIVQLFSSGYGGCCK